MGDRPNFLVLMSDQHNPHVLGCAGDAVARTPNLDRLAADGALFEHVYCQSPLCVPSRMSFLTARHPSDIGVWSNSCILPSETPTFAHGLAAAGYDTTLVGRMHFLGPDQYHGFNRRLVGSLTSIFWGGAFPALPPELLRATGQNLAAVATAGYGRTGYQAYDEDVAQATARRLHEYAGADGPFCIVAGFVLPHCPFVCPREDWDYCLDRVDLPRTPSGYFQTLHPAMQESLRQREITDLTDQQVRRARAGYYGIVTHFDRQVGVVLDALERSGLVDNTIVVYVSDHGEMAGEHGQWWKGLPYEGCAAAPMIISAPGRFVGGRRVREVVSLVDVGPTLLAAAGAAPLPEARGRDLLGLLRGDAPEQPGEAFSEHQAVRDVPAWRMIRRGRWKLTHYHGLRPQLFDLESDPDEFHDLAADAAHAPLRDDLQRRVLDGWSAERMSATLTARARGRKAVRDWYAHARLWEGLLWQPPEGANEYTLIQ